MLVQCEVIKCQRAKYAEPIVKQDTDLDIQIVIIKILINEFIDSVESSMSKIDNYYPVIYPDVMNEETKKYIAYADYKNLEKEINAFIENGGI